MRSSLSLIPAMALALAAQTALAQQQQPTGGEQAPAAQAAPGTAAGAATDDLVPVPRGRAGNEAAPQGGATPDGQARTTATGTATDPEEPGTPLDLGREVGQQAEQPPLPEDPMGHLNRTDPQPGQIARPTDQDVTRGAVETPVDGAGPDAAAAAPAEGMDTQAQAPGQQAQGQQHQQQGEPPTPLPDVPAAVAEELERQGVDGVEIPPSIEQRAETPAEVGQPAQQPPAPADAQAEAEPAGDTAEGAQADDAAPATPAGQAPVGQPAAPSPEGGR